MTRTYKYRIYPNDEQEQMLARFFGCVRKMYNLCLDWWTEAYQLWKDNGTPLRDNATADASVSRNTRSAVSAATRTRRTTTRIASASLTTGISRYRNSGRLKSSCTARSRDASSPFASAELVQDITTSRLRWTLQRSSRL